nr:nascent polypeptide-associated complex subunit beta [Quercus suber]
MPCELVRILPALTISSNARASCGKGTPRRKVKKVHKNSGTDDKKLQTALKKMNVQPIQAIEEVNMFKSDGNVIHFSAPKVHASVPSNTFAIYGNGEDKELTELVPGILNQLGPDSLASLRKLAESYQSLQKSEGGEDKKDDDDDEIPDLVEGENFDSTKADVERSTKDTLAIQSQHTSQAMSLTGLCGGHPRLGATDFPDM